MPTASYEVRVSFREQDRPRLMQATAVDSDGAPVVGVSLRLDVDDNGSLEEETAVRTRDVVTGVGGTAYFRWWQWPRNGPQRDLTSLIMATWESEEVDVWLQDLYE